MKLPPVFQRYRQSVESTLRNILDTDDSLLYRMMRYHMGWVDEGGNPTAHPSGKALRPTLCLMACEATGGDFTRAVPVAAALELIHNFSLIHDDVQDDDRQRRHRPTVWSIWGKPQAINAGTAMRILANAAIRRLDLSLTKSWRLQNLLDETTLRLIEGQCMDIAFESTSEVSVDAYLEMIRGKTASLISCSMEAGALVSTDDDALISQFRDLGSNLGLAFQIRDDILGIWGVEDSTGKPRGGDIWRKKKSFPVIFALNEDGSPEIPQIYGGNGLTEAGFATVMRILQETGAREAAQSMVQRYSQRAEDALNEMRLPDQARGELREVIGFLIDRDH